MSKIETLGWFSGLARKYGHHNQADWLDAFRGLEPQPEGLRSDGSTRASRQAEVDTIFEDANRAAARMGAWVEPDPDRIQRFVEGPPSNA